MSPFHRAWRPRRFLCCEPAFFEVRYAINPWMREGEPVDAALAREQWRALVAAYRAHGHTVETIEPVPGLPDMVFAANAALVLEGRVFGSRFLAPQRQPEAEAYRTWFKAAGFEVHEVEPGAEPDYADGVVREGVVCEGEGDLVPAGGLVLAGSGFRTTPEAHRQAQEFFGVPVVGLRLTDPYFYHLDTALFVLDEENIAYYPGAFSPGSREVLRRLFPDAVLAGRDDAMAFGLNAVSDGRHVFVAPGARDLIDALDRRGYVPVPVEMTELHKAGGGIKCCTQEIRGPKEAQP
jgi:N-dimethylarginine dimethylaminohydrolase